MRKAFILIPLLLCGVTPYYQVTNNNTKTDSINDLQRDTLLFPVIETDIKIQKQISEKLNKRLEKATNELKRLERIERQKKKDKRELQEIEEMFNKYDNRGL